MPSSYWSLLTGSTSDMKNESRNKSPNCILFVWCFATHFKSFIRNIKQVIKFKLFPSSLVRELVKSVNKSEIIATWRAQIYASQSSLMESGHNFQFKYIFSWHKVMEYLSWKWPWRSYTPASSLYTRGNSFTTKKTELSWIKWLVIQ